MKKVSLLTLALSMTAAGVATAQAPVSNPCPCPKAFQGFFLGANLGYGSGSVKSSATQTLPTPTSKIQSSNIGVLGVDGGLNVGYTHRLNNFGLGIEGVFNWAGSNGKIYSPASGIEFKTRLQNTIQIRANLSYVICNLVAPKIFLGWDTSEWNNTTIFNAGNVAGNTSPLKSTSNKTRFNGLAYGAGVDFLLAKHVIAGLEWSGVSAASKSYNASGLLQGTQTTYSVSNRPTYNKFAVTVKFIY